MKLQLIILGLLVVATFAHRHGDEEGENRYGRRRHYRSRVRNDNQIAANAKDSDLEDSISSEEENVNTEQSHKGCGGRHGKGRGGHRHHFQHTPEYHQRSGVDGNEGFEHNHQSGHNAEWHEKHGVPMPNGESNGQWGHHHHKHHHHHHHHRTTTTAAPTTTSTSTVPPSAEEYDTATE